jgi:hypothetical protein
MTAWQCVAHVVSDPPTADWRDALARRLGERPRRIGIWAELAIHGARACLDLAGEDVLPVGARMRVAGFSGAMSATRAATQQGARGLLPMPFGFMQSQPGQMLAAVGASLGWRGDASFMLGRDAPALLRLAQLGAGPQGLLFGRVEETQQEDAVRLRTEWWRFVPTRR